MNKPLSNLIAPEPTAVLKPKPAFRMPAMLYRMLIDSKPVKKSKAQLQREQKGIEPKSSLVQPRQADSIELVARHQAQQNALKNLTRPSYRKLCVDVSSLACRLRRQMKRTIAPSLLP
jgi:hypothetical protein